MTAYHNILVAYELSDAGVQVLQRASELAAMSDANLHLVHVIEPVFTDSPFDVMPAVPPEYEELFSERVKQEMLKQGGRLGLDCASMHIENGSVKYSLLTLANRLHADLIVVGSHGRHGVQLLLGSTANAVLHGAKCDVLAVRIND